MQIADLHSVGRQHGRDVIAIIVYHVDRTRARDDGDDRLAVVRRGECSGEAAAILLVDHQREGNARQPRLTYLLFAMMRRPT